LITSQRNFLLSFGGHVPENSPVLLQFLFSQNDHPGSLEPVGLAHLALRSLAFVVDFHPDPGIAQFLGQETFPLRFAERQENVGVPQVILLSGRSSRRSTPIANPIAGTGAADLFRQPSYLPPRRPHFGLPGSGHHFKSRAGVVVQPRTIRGLTA
jgi:hypothetical protein